MTFWSQLFKRWIALSGELISIKRIVQLVSHTLIHWILIYPVDSAIQLLNNWDLVTSPDALPLKATEDSWELSSRDK